MDSFSASPLDKVLADWLSEAASTVAGPLIIGALLIFALVSLLLDKIPTRTVIGAHFTIFLFAAWVTRAPILLTGDILLRTAVILVLLKFVGAFFAWLGEPEGIVGPRLCTLAGVAVVATITLGSAVAKEAEKSKHDLRRDQRW